MLVFKSVYLLITILVFRTSCVNGAEKSKKTVLNIGGIFPILGKGGWQGGQGKEFFKNIYWIFRFLLPFTPFAAIIAYPFVEFLTSHNSNKITKIRNKQ